MYPYIHLGPVTLGTYGLMMGLAFVCAWRLLEVSFQRRNLTARQAESLILLLAITGIAGSKLYHMLERPAELLIHPLSIVNPSGFAWFGGLLAGVVALWLFARQQKIQPLLLMDITSPAAALGYGIGRLGCLLSGDGDYGRPTSLPWAMSFPSGTVPTLEYVHPTPLYELIVSLAIFFYLRTASKKNPPYGVILAWYLILSGTARFLVKFFRINSPLAFDLSNAQVASLGSVAGGILILKPWRLMNRPGCGVIAVLPKGRFFDER